ncbi:MAG: sugar kinase [Anaerolineaceae bacterium]|nr:sugar kinase [Anaerolineaceae bacterium]
MTRSVLSRETPLFPRPVVREQYSCGGAANVAWNLAALGPAQTRAFTVFGRDWRGELLLQALREVGVDTESVLIDREWTTPFFGKVMLQSGRLQQEDARLDFINTAALSSESEEELLARVEAGLPDLDALVVADYQAVGVITRRVLEGLNDLAARYPRVIFAVDSRERIGQFWGMVRKPNDIEAARWLFPERAPEQVRIEELAEAGLHPQVDCSCPLVITLGDKGCLVLDGGESHLVPALKVAPPIDTVGAGDTFLAALTLALAGGAAAVEAARLGHLAAAVTIHKLGITGAASAEEIREIYEQNFADCG